jgi:hypothetical protein
MTGAALEELGEIARDADVGEGLHVEELGRGGADEGRVRGRGDVRELGQEADVGVAPVKA